MRLKNQIFSIQFFFVNQNFFLQPTQNKINKTIGKLGAYKKYIKLNETISKIL